MGQTSRKLHTKFIRMAAPLDLPTGKMKGRAEIAPELADRLKLDERNQRTIPLTLAELKAIKEKAGNPQGARYFLADHRRVEKPYRPCKNPGGGDFWKTLSGKVSAWCWRVRNRELMILEMGGQVDFFPVPS